MAAMAPTAATAAAIVVAVRATPPTAAAVAAAAPAPAAAAPAAPAPAAAAPAAPAPAAVVPAAPVAAPAPAPAAPASTACALASSGARPYIPKVIVAMTRIRPLFMANPPVKRPKTIRRTTIAPRTAHVSRGFPTPGFAMPVALQGDPTLPACGMERKVPGAQGPRHDGQARERKQSFGEGLRTLCITRRPGSSTRSAGCKTYNRDGTLPATLAPRVGEAKAATRRDVYPVGRCWLFCGRDCRRSYVPHRLPCWSRLSSLLPCWSRLSSLLRRLSKARPSGRSQHHGRLVGRRVASLTWDFALA